MKFLQKCSVLIVLFALPSLGVADSKAELKLGYAPVDDIVNAMTIDEKISMIRGTGMDTEDGGLQVGIAQNKVPGAAGTTFAIDRLSLHEEADAGDRIRGHNILISSTTT